MSAKLDDTQWDAFVDCITFLVDLVRKRRQERSTLSDGAHEDDPAPAVAADVQAGRRVDSTSSQGDEEVRTKEKIVGNTPMPRLSKPAAYQLIATISNDLEDGQ